ncbi:YchJ family protein [Paraglaciecola arctica]|uniref:SEC-C motif domain protein n=1 Tax=Paraglaciecola arctica BSs20135 TaxID=493475 RepID=K6Z7X6_9ALTE|nr:YchJ family protein [Paraglaciecola arctica]GAC19550.1 SEC-C motif domain protein [Paraglaciecola arctica BSs20135]
MTTSIKNCFCGNEFTFEQCCQPIIAGKVNAKNAEELMRSRFTAYVIKNYQYILQTYASAQRAKLTVSELTESSQDTRWLSLQVLTHFSQKNTAQVEFKAFYQVDSCYYVMHELSDFVFEAGRWLYTEGVMQKGSGKFSPERNSQCLCASSKKFKKCCAR